MGAAGGIAALTGLALSFFTFGVSLAVTGVGLAVGITGGVTGAVCNITNMIKQKNLRQTIEKIINDFQNTINPMIEHMNAISNTIEELQQAEQAYSVQNKDCNKMAQYRRLSVTSAGSSTSDHSMNVPAGVIKVLKEHGYTIEQELGRGASGIAFLVKDTDGDLYVVKQMNSRDGEELDAVRKEVEILNNLNFGYIVTYVNSFEDKEAGRIYIVMEYCEGGDLSKVMEKHKDEHFFEEKQILDWLVQICLALQYLHEKKILHRDIKPQNIFLTEDGYINLGDFGCSKHWKELMNMPNQLWVQISMSAQKFIRRNISPRARGDGIQKSGQTEHKQESLSLEQSPEDSRRLSDIHDALAFTAKPARLPRFRRRLLRIRRDRQCPHSRPSQGSTGIEGMNRGDIWSLGWLLHDLCMLDVWADNMQRHIIHAVSMKGNPPHISERYSVELRELIRQMLSRDPKDRPSAEEILAKPFLEDAVDRNGRTPETLLQSFMKSINAFDKAYNKHYKDIEDLVNEWGRITDSMESAHYSATAGSLSGSVIGAAGGITALVGLILAPFTLGASLIVTGVGVGVGVAGGVTGAASTITNTVQQKSFRESLEQIQKKYDSVSEPILTPLNTLRKGAKYELRSGLRQGYKKLKED
ncbi:hypothetical protein G5714_008694 [Onychostoma macrolepis]|uniref:non-specific serine/threonine protein kinase n=1 Tax=Onychostoma macrolepis TaxID=369639 RepID=A0A7J6CYA1_9TELE|nr:hypothetical protein G5714_008694 [Onychostoma macrolepis]